ncbi:6-phosphofructokinase [Tessaracoccus sp. OH4464_COT-324]|uniref:6-phosphofructokinase n=1 Tax=Tessaracoccus sp. OH4464_COT-324 TaxID=2491059 RepID=UPI000F63C6E3|nr:6-phosphofructokinase [Tessaracoccus sp. OH4464_COT-324]RRD48056.1 6-phosphofructokinase [Tessaracoccus sp. OH4464_COT-324]
MTSGGDAQGMNAAVRAITRAGLHAGVDVFAIREGWQGAVEGGKHIVQLHWSSVSGLLNKGGTIIGTARSAEMRTREGQRRAVHNLVQNGIDRLIVIGGDGSLTGARELMLGWQDLLDDLVSEGKISQEQASKHKALHMAGVVGSIDNDMIGTDMTIGTDSALHRITEAIDALSSTAESHRRTFVVEVMGRNCGYLALMSTISGGADYCFLPESPPRDGWEERMVDVLERARAAGRRDSIIVVAEGAKDRAGVSITTDRVCSVIEELTGEKPRATILGHVARGGKPSAYDRWMATACGVEAVRAVLESGSDDEPVLVGMSGDEVVRVPLMESVKRTREIATFVAEGRYAEAIASRGAGFESMIQIYRTLVEARPSIPEASGKRIGVMHAGALAPGMNQIDRAAVRFGLDRGHEVWAILGGVPGLSAGTFRQVKWSDVEGMASLGGAAFGTRRYIPDDTELYGMSRQLEEHGIDALLISGGYHAYATVRLLIQERRRFPAFNIPIALLPASIDNNLPGWPMAVGADTALNTLVDAIDMIRMSASASKRAFVVEAMGRGCGFLPLLSGIAGGAEKVYLPETGITLDEVKRDIDQLVRNFELGRSFYLSILGEDASEHFTAEVLANLFEAEGRGLYSVRTSVVGHLQQGGTPSAFDRINATRLAYHAIAYLDDQLGSGRSEYGVARSGVPGLMSPADEVLQGMDWEEQRPRRQWWLSLNDIASQLSTPPGDATLL